MIMDNLLKRNCVCFVIYIYYLYYLSIYNLYIQIGQTFGMKQLMIALSMIFILEKIQFEQR